MEGRLWFFVRLVKQGNWYVWFYCFYILSSWRMVSWTLDYVVCLGWGIYVTKCNHELRFLWKFNVVLGSCGLKNLRRRKKASGLKREIRTTSGYPWPSDTVKSPGFFKPRETHTKAQSNFFIFYFILIKMLHVVPPWFRTLVEVNSGTLNANTYNSRSWKDSMTCHHYLGVGGTQNCCSFCLK